MLEEGRTDVDILKYMKDTYFISEKKGELAIQIAKREKALLDTLHYEDGYSLYIGIKFWIPFILAGEHLPLWRQESFQGCLKK